MAWQGRVLPRVLVPLRPLRAQPPPDLHTSVITAENHIPPGTHLLTKPTCALLQGLNMRDGHKKSAATQAAVFFLLLMFPGFFYSLWNLISVQPQVASRTNCLVRTTTTHLRSAAGRVTFSQGSLLREKLPGPSTLLVDARRRAPSRRSSTLARPTGRLLQTTTPTCRASRVCRPPACCPCRPGA